MIELMENPTPNARLLCLCARGIPLSWESELAKIRQYVETSPKLHLTRGEILARFIFLSPPTTPNLEQIDSLLGLEVIGYELFSPESPYKLIDLDQGSCHGLKTLLPHPSRAQLFDLANQKFQELSTPLTKLWQVLYTTKGIDIQFFDKIYNNMLLKGLEEFSRGHYSE